VRTLARRVITESLGLFSHSSLLCPAPRPHFDHPHSRLAPGHNSHWQSVHTLRTRGFPSFLIVSQLAP
jgi:hypothetical protein